MEDGSARWRGQSGYDRHLCVKFYKKNHCSALFTQLAKSSQKETHIKKEGQEYLLQPITETAQPDSE